MIFAPEKSELIHFIRIQKLAGQEIRFLSKVVRPTESARFLGVWLDRKLRWTRHFKQLKVKMAMQQLAFTKLVASI